MDLGAQRRAVQSNSHSRPARSARTSPPGLGTLRSSPLSLTSNASAPRLQPARSWRLGGRRMLPALLVSRTLGLPPAGPTLGAIPSPALERREGALAAGAQPELAQGEAVLAVPGALPRALRLGLRATDRRALQPSPAPVRLDRRPLAPAREAVEPILGLSRLAAGNAEPLGLLPAQVGPLAFEVGSVPFPSECPRSRVPLRPSGRLRAPGAHPRERRAFR